MHTDQTTDAGAQAAPASTTEGAQAAPVTTSAGAQAAPVDDQLARVRAEAASWRVKTRELETQMAEMQGQLTSTKAAADEAERLRSTVDALTDKVRGANLEQRLRGELAQLGVMSKGQQDLIIAAKRPTLAVTYNEEHQPMGEFTESLKAAVDLLGLTAPVATPPASGLVPPVITTPRKGNLTYEERVESGQRALERARSGEYVP